MNCPNCSHPVRIDSSSCYHCGFDVVESQETYGVDLAAIDRITEVYQAGGGHGLGRIERLMLNRTLDRLERQFPEMAFAVCFFELATPVQLQPYGFWLLNHGLLAGKDRVQANANGAILMVDQCSQAAGFVLGYVVEQFLEDKDLVRCLEAGERHFQEGKYGSGANASLKVFGNILARRVRAGGAVTRRSRPAAAPAPAPRDDWKDYIRRPVAHRDVDVRRAIHDVEPNRI